MSEAGFSVFENKLCIHVTFNFLSIIIIRAVQLFIDENRVEFYIADFVQNF